MKWGHRLATARRRAGISQRELATRTRVPQSTVGRIEAGLVEPRIQTYDKLLRACGDMVDTVRQLGVGQDRTQIHHNLRRPADDRLADHFGFLKVFNAGRKHRGESPIVFDPLRQLHALAASDVRFIVIGGVAACLLGSPSLTTDLDICHLVAPENIGGLRSVLRQLGAQVSPDALQRTSIADSDRFSFETLAGRLDCAERPSGTDGFDSLAANAVEIPLPGFSVLVASLDDLIRMKRAAGRIKDLVHLEVLGALREELGE